MPYFEKTLVWIGSAKKDLIAFPENVKNVFGYALHLAQHGEKHLDAKPLKGFGGAKTLEVIEDHQGDTYRAVYTVKFEGYVYVLHCFQKKSKKGIATPKPDMDKIRARLKDAELLHQELTRCNMSKVKHEVSSGNVFADIGVAESVESLAKAELARKVGSIIKHRHLNQTEAAKLLGIDQPKVSRLLRGQLKEFSMTKLLDFMLRLDRDIEIRIKKHRSGRLPPGIEVLSL